MDYHEYKDELFFSFAPFFENEIISAGRYIQYKSKPSFVTKIPSSHASEFKGKACGFSYSLINGFQFECYFLLHPIQLLYFFGKKMI